MEATYTEGKKFSQDDLIQHPLTRGSYENCSFSNCDLSNIDLSGFHFIDCTFSGCNLSMAKLGKTNFRDVTFNGCKMLGLLFYDCSEYGLAVGFNDCNLGHASFYNTKIKKTRFINSKLNATDFTDCDLSSAVIDNCDLADAKFENTNLEKADLRRSYNYSIDPAMNRVKKARFSLDAVAGLLDKYDIEIDPVNS